MDLVAENLDGAVVLNISSVCTGQDGQECRGCIDIGGLIHNWLMTTEIRYLILDLQDEKDVCRTFIVEMMQLRKRLKIPFLFAGVMERPKKTLLSYAVDGPDRDVFTTPEDAIEKLRQLDPRLLEVTLEGINFGEPIVSLKARQMQRAQEAEDVPADDI